MHVRELPTPNEWSSNAAERSRHSTVFSARTQRSAWLQVLGKKSNTLSKPNHVSSCPIHQLEAPPQQPHWQAWALACQIRLPDRQACANKWELLQGGPADVSAQVDAVLQPRPCQVARRLQHCERRRVSSSCLLPWQLQLRRT